MRLDGVHADIVDLDGLEIAYRQGVPTGLDGETIVRPNQTDPADHNFSPDLWTIEEASEEMAAYEATPRQGVTTQNSGVIELLHTETARRLFAVAVAVVDG